MTEIQKAIFKEIKKHNEKGAYLEGYNKNIKFVSMEIYPYGEHFTKCYNNEKDEYYLTRYQVKCKFKPVEKYDNSIVIYQVNMYSDGSIAIYYDGTTSCPYG